MIDVLLLVEYCIVFVGCNIMTDGGCGVPQDPGGNCDGEARVRLESVQE